VVLVRVVHQVELVVPVDIVLLLLEKTLVVALVLKLHHSYLHRQTTQ
jgi:hypothetical protein